MKLYITQPSPYARKCRIVARELGLAGGIQEVIADPYGDDPALLAANPIVQVPTLIAGDGRPVVDSTVICEHLNEIGGGGLLPASGPARLKVRRLETLANGALEMGVKLLLEQRRPEGERSASWTTRWTRNLNAALDRLEAEAIAGEPLDMGLVAIGSLLTWLDFRHPTWPGPRRGPTWLDSRAFWRPGQASATRGLADAARRG